MRVLVIGGCGFIGSNFLKLLLKKLPDVFVCNVDKLTYAGNLANVRKVANSYPDRYAFERADIADRQAIESIVKKYEITAIIKFAAESHVDRSTHDAMPFIQTNIVGTQVLLDLAKKYSLDRFLQVSTDEVYGTLGPSGLFTEKTALAPNNPYSASKASADFLCRAFFETYDFPVIITRCSNNYGANQFPEKLNPLMFKRAMENRPLPVYGDGKNVRDWIHV